MSTTKTSVPALLQNTPPPAVTCSVLRNVGSLGQLQMETVGSRRGSWDPATAELILRSELRQDLLLLFLRRAEHLVAAVAKAFPGGAPFLALMVTHTPQ